MNWLRKLLAWLGWVDLVWFLYYDGDWGLRIKRKGPFGPFIHGRHGFINKVRLCEGGRCVDTLHTRWIPYGETDEKA